MAKEYDNKRNVAKHMYVVENKTAKEIATLLDVAQKTIGDWVKKFGWREERDAKATSSRKRVENLEQIISGLAEKRLRLERQIDEETSKPSPDLEIIEAYRKEIASVDYAVANWNKSLLNVKKESKITAAQYYMVMEDVFKSLMQFDYQLYLTTIDFQQHHVESISNRKTVL